MSRFRVRGASMPLTTDAVPREDRPEPSGMSVERGRPAGASGTRQIAVLPGSPVDYFIAATSDNRGAALWQVMHLRGDPGVDPLDEDDTRRALRGEPPREGRDEGRYRYDPGVVWTGEGAPEEIERRDLVERTGERVAAADRAFVRSPTHDAGRALGRATRQHDAAQLAAVNAAARRRYG